MPFISLLIPCYNEEKRLDNTIQALQEFEKSFDKSFEVILINDGSTDGTVDRINRDAYLNKLRLNGQFQLIDLGFNAGKGGALKAGVKNASGDFILTLDADISTHPLEINKWIKSIELNDKKILIGSRELPESKISELPLRNFIGKVFNLVIRSFTGLNIQDTQCGFKLYPATIGKKVFEELQVTGWAHDVEILCRVKKHGAEIIEMPISWETKDGSKISVMSDSVKMFMEVVKISYIIRK